MKSCIYPKTIHDKADQVREPQILEFQETSYRYYSQDATDNLRERVREQLRRAFREEQIHVFLQPRIRLRTETVCAAEALARWYCPDKSWNLPEQFLPLLERLKLISELDFYMLEQVAKIQQQWREQYDCFMPISVNISGDTLLQPDIVKRLMNLQHKYALKPGQMELELTEHCIMEQQESLTIVLQQLQKAGFPICLDDFGVGSSSLSMLLDLPVRNVKLDRSFLKKYNTSERMNVYIAALIEMLQKAGVKTIVEGVETGEQVEFLRMLPVEQGQGWYWERPIHWRMFMHHYVLDKPRKNCYYI